MFQNWRIVRSNFLNKKLKIQRIDSSGYFKTLNGPGASMKGYS
jgi:hypothetical protein